MHIRSTKYKKHKVAEAHGNFDDNADETIFVKTSSHVSYEKWKQGVVKSMKRFTIFGLPGYLILR